MSTAPSAPVPCAEGHCITCSDEAVAMTVLRIDERRGLALCADGDGVRRTVETALVEPCAPGEQLLVHANVAIASLPDGVPA